MLTSQLSADCSLTWSPTNSRSRWISHQVLTLHYTAGQSVHFLFLYILHDHRWAPNISHHLFHWASWTHTQPHQHYTPVHLSAPPPPIYPKTNQPWKHHQTERKVSVPEMHSANEPNELSDDIEMTTTTRRHPTLHFVIAHWYSCQWGDPSLGTM